MRAVIRDLLDYVDDNSPLGEDLDGPRLRTFIDALQITAGMTTDEDLTRYVAELRAAAKRFGQARGNGQS